MTQRILHPKIHVDECFFDITHHHIPNGVEAHGHSCVEIVVVARGSADHWLDGELRRLYPGCVVIIRPGSVHRIMNARSLEIFNVSCPLELFTFPELQLRFLEVGRKLFGAEGRSVLFALPGLVFQDVCSLLTQMEEAFSNRQQEEVHLKLRTWFILLLLILIQSWKAEVNQSATSMELTIAFMEEHYSKPLTLDELAQRTMMSRSQFLTKFHRETGTTPRQYLIDLRLHHACVMLAKGNMTTEQIAFACGFCDGNHLRRIYRQRFGVAITRRKER